MLIELKWLAAANNQGSRTEIWRSSEPFTEIDTAELIATVEPGVTTYADSDVIQGNKYYYRFRNVIGTLKSPLSKQFEFEANQYTGPGPTRTKFGDEHFGYYGVFPDDPLVVPTINHIRLMFGLPLASSEIDKAPLHKFAVGGTVRGIHTAPLALGSEVSSTNPWIKRMLDGGVAEIQMGLHKWAIVIPSAEHAHNPEHDVQHFPGELRSMLGVVTEMYSRIEDAETGNTTGDRLIRSTGQVEFYNPLLERFPGKEVKWIISTDWVDDKALVINWTTAEGPPPLRPKELHIETVDYSQSDNWNKTLIWPVLVYTGLTGPTA